MSLETALSILLYSTKFPEIKALSVKYPEFRHPYCQIKHLAYIQWLLRSKNHVHYVGLLPSNHPRKWGQFNNHHVVAVNCPNLKFHTSNWATQSTSYSCTHIWQVLLIFSSLNEDNHWIQMSLSWASWLDFRTPKNKKKYLLLNSHY